jgi:hypothetical protein
MVLRMEASNLFRSMEYNTLQTQTSSNYLKAASPGLLKFLSNYKSMILIKYSLLYQMKSFKKKMQF